MDWLHIHISFGIDIKSIGSSSQQQRYTITIYSTANESNPMNLGKAFYILPSEVVVVIKSENEL